MGNAGLVWAVFAPLVAGLLSALCWLLRGERRVPRKAVRWLEIAALSLVCMGLLAEGPLLLWTRGDATLFDLTLNVRSYAAAGILAANASLLCAVFIGWSHWLAEGKGRAPTAIWASAAVSALLAAGLLATDAVVQALCLFGVALAVSAASLLEAPVGYVASDGARTLLALRVGAGLKHLALSAVGTGLMIVGALLLARYGLSMENGQLLRTGLAVLSTGLVVRAGAMPFSAAYPDMTRSSPAVAVMALGAGVPAVITLGLRLVLPVQGATDQVASLAWLGPAAALLAGIRAGGLRISNFEFRISESASSNPKFDIRYSQSLAAMSVAVATGWAIFGVLSGSSDGAAGASLVAANIALAVPLLVASGLARATNRRLADLGTAVGALSLLGLPPFGGAIGIFLLAQTAVAAHGLLLAVLLLGSLALAGAWLGWLRQSHAEEGAPPSLPPPRQAWLSPLPILVCTLIAAQLALFFLSRH